MSLVSTDAESPHRKINKSPTTVEDPAVLKVPLTKPLVKRIDLHFPLGMEVTARNLKGVTIKDALDAIYKAYKKRVRFTLVFFGGGGGVLPPCQPCAALV